MSACIYDIDDIHEKNRLRKFWDYLKKPYFTGIAHFYREACCTFVALWPRDTL